MSYFKSQGIKSITDYIGGTYLGYIREERGLRESTYILITCEMELI